jgi:hypothetical protein
MPADRFMIAGCAIAAQLVGYPRIAQMIVEDALGTEAIVRLFQSSASKTWRHDCALIVLAGSVARWKASPDKWSGEVEAAIARELVGADFQRVSDASARLVAARWLSIQELAHGAEAAA